MYLHMGSGTNACMHKISHKMDRLCKEGSSTHLESCVNMRNQSVMCGFTLSCTMHRDYCISAGCFTCAKPHTLMFTTCYRETTWEKLVYVNKEPLWQTVVEN